MRKKIFVYTDASFCKTLNLGVAGWLIFQTELEHQSGQISSEMIFTTPIEEKNNIRVEIKGVISALEAILTAGNNAGKAAIHLYTDCQTTVGLLARRQKLESTNFISRKKQKALNNSDLYKKFFSVYDLLKPDIHWVKGHSLENARNLEMWNFSVIDKIVRAELRTIVRNTPEKEVL